MNYKIRLYLLFYIVLCLSGCGSSWLTFENSEKAFSIKMPGKPEKMFRIEVVSEGKIIKSGGKLDADYFIMTAFSVKYPEDYIQKFGKNEKDILKYLLELHLEDKTKNIKKTVFGKYDGKPSLTFERTSEQGGKGPIQQTQRVVLNGNYAYFLETVAATGFEDNFKEDFDKFFNSLIIQK